MKKREKGQSLFELVVALAIATIIIVALVSLASVSIRNATFSKNKTLASRYAQEATEWLRSERDADPAGFLTHSQTLKWCIQTLSWDLVGGCSSQDTISGTPFVRELSFATTTVIVGGVDKTLITAEISVTWEDAQGLHEVKSSTDFSDWRQR